MPFIDANVHDVLGIGGIRVVLPRQPIIEEVDGSAVRGQAVDEMLGKGRVSAGRRMVVALRATDLHRHSKG